MYVMKQRIIIAAVTALVAGAACFFAGKGCTPEPVTQTVTKTVRDTVRLKVPGTTVTMPGHIVYRERFSDLTDTAAVRKMRDSLRALAADNNLLAEKLTELAYMRATGDATLDRVARITIGTTKVEVPFTDTLHLWYDFPPLGEFGATVDSVDITAPEAVVETIKAEDARPWYYDVLTAIGGALVPILVALIEKM